MAKRWGRYEIVERSMAPALLPGDWVMAKQREVRRGDVVVLTAPNGLTMAKRVVAVAGESVRIADGAVFVEGDREDAVLPTPGGGSWRVGEGEVFVLSDARDRTRADSRTFGPIPIALVRGVVRCRYWPRNRMGRVR